METMLKKGVVDVLKKIRELICKIKLRRFYKKECKTLYNKYIRKGGK